MIANIFKIRENIQRDGASYMRNRKSKIENRIALFKTICGKVYSQPKKLIIWAAVALFATAFICGIHTLNAKWREQHPPVQSGIQYEQAKVLDIIRRTVRAGI